MDRPKPSLLIADDQADVLKALRLLLKPHDYQITCAGSVTDIIDLVKARDLDVLLMDMNYVRGETSGGPGLVMLERLRQTEETLPISGMTAWSSVELGVEAMRRGARDFVPKPWQNERLLAVLQTQLELGRALRRGKRLEREVDCLRAADVHQLIAESPAMRPVLEIIDRVGPSDANVLITGENGSGKGVVAEALHRASQRHQKTMVTVNTASIPDTIFESELFGHVAGAFTDAKTDRIGRFELAHQGTLFLDEIAAVPRQMQSKLLRVLENGAFERIGSSKTCHVDARILSATNAYLDEEVAQGRFRQDLLYRLNTVLLHIPPLRERREDISLLANHFLQRYVTKYRKEITSFTANTLQFLLDYPWPGNVRELDHAIERAVLMSQDDRLHPGDLGLTTREQSAPVFERMTIEEIERWALRKALERSAGDISKAAATLGLSRAALYRRLEKYGMS